MFKNIYDRISRRLPNTYNLLYNIYLRLIKQLEKKLIEKAPESPNSKKGLIGSSSHNISIPKEIHRNESNNFLRCNDDNQYYSSNLQFNWPI